MSTAEPHRIHTKSGRAADFVIEVFGPLRYAGREAIAPRCNECFHNAGLVARTKRAPVPIEVLWAESGTISTSDPDRISAWVNLVQIVQTRPESSGGFSAAGRRSAYTERGAH